MPSPRHALVSSLCAATVGRSVAHARTELRRARERAVGRPEVRRGHRRTPDDTPASSATGLSSAAARRLTRHGPNAIPEEPPTPVWRRVLQQLRDPLIWCCWWPPP
ncbi:MULTISPECIES: cation-transporting P-type ATPase [unclassified Streptomyces]|uniref:Cation-transporting P-type ATPase n=1 Tax=Streptomyces sp. R17 TaxID=3238626 RepID=A0AB39NY46_9ACTN|nr:cation-transporting P-type ATPase [Streptomyces sp. MMS20-AI2-20]MCI4145729.1 cation-transporting P-type ATPase [Streptomyces sp. MMS20-AI2-20]MCM3300446.1 cation-transporting P-type ATPase [Streptomyces pseudogriseolus]